MLIAFQGTDKTFKAVRSISFTAEEAVRYILETDRDSCSEQPIGCTDSEYFLVDLSKLDHRDDIRADDLGVWCNRGVKSSYCCVRFRSGTVLKVEVLDFKPPMMSSSTYRLKCTYWVHSEDRRACRRLFELEGTLPLTYQALIKKLF